MTKIVHETPGLIDIRALTVMGLSAKPNTKSPIGMFGTGLKYSVAVLCRLGASPVLWIGEESHTFTLKRDEFRGSEFNHIRCKVKNPRLARPRYYSLPFTTEYGKFWEPWMVFRELHSNTLDENGSTIEFDGEYKGAKDWTAFVIDCPAYFDAWSARDTIFLPGANRNSTGFGPDVETVGEGESEFLYWRGLRVSKLAKKSVARWNILKRINLTEDRTLAYEWQAREAVAAWLAAHCKDAKLIERCITADQDHYEHRLPFRESGATPSDLFKEVALRCKSRAHGVMGWVSGYIPSAAPKTKTEWEKAERPWSVDSDEDASTIHAKDGRAILAKPEGFDGDWSSLAKAICNRINRDYAAPADEDLMPF